MTFYNSIVNAYDEIFPFNKSQLSCIESVYPILSGKKMVDAGCGTGALAIECGRRGAAVKAFDLDENMVLKAKEKCPQALDVSFSIGNLLDFSSVYKAQGFDLACCFGNTLAHLNNGKDVCLFLESVYNVLKPGGVMMLQIVNYNRIVDGKIDHLPTIESEHYTFKRNYSMLNSGKINFSTVLMNKISLEAKDQTVELLPIRKELLNDWLKELKFVEINFYGSFSREPWSGNSFHTIVEAKRGV